MLRAENQEQTKADRMKQFVSINKEEIDKEIDAMVAV